MTMIEKLVDWYPEESLLIADGFNDAIIGIDESSMRIIYSVTRCIEILCLDEEMDVEDAIEHFNYNVKGAYVGEKTPIWCEDNF
jgi:hypothetical protein